jgi:hypothetical protein
MLPLDRTAMATKYPGKWVALKADRMTVLTSGESVQEVLKQVHDIGEKNPVITRMPKDIRSFIITYPLAGLTKMKCSAIT